MLLVNTYHMLLGPVLEECESVTTWCGVDSEVSKQAMNLIGCAGIDWIAGVQE